MKVYFCDYTHHKTSRHWYNYLKQNHQVVEDMYFNPVYAEWADVIYVEWAEGSAIEASRGKGHYDGVYDHEGVWGDKNAQYTKDFDWTGKPIYIRGIDIDILFGHFRQINFENVTGFMTIAPHIDRITNDGSVAYPEKLKRAIIPLSVDLNEWTLNERKGYKLAWINHHWSAKGFPLMLQAFAKLVSCYPNNLWELHVVENGRSTEHWLFRYIEHMLIKLNIKDRVFFYPTVDSVDQFLQDKDVVVSSSHKEAFSLILAEAMAKGMPALTHSWEGAEEIWPEDMVWITIDEFPSKLTELQKKSPTFFIERASKYSKEKEIQALRKMTNL